MSLLPGRVNIISGASKTGKSAIILIIDYFFPVVWLWIGGIGVLSERARARAVEFVGDDDIRRRLPKGQATNPEATRLAPIPVPVSLDNGVPIRGSLITRE